MGTCCFVSTIYYKRCDTGPCFKFLCGARRGGEREEGWGEEEEREKVRKRVIERGEGRGCGGRRNNLN